MLNRIDSTSVLQQFSLSRFFAALADIYFWQDASKACFIAFCYSVVSSFFALWYWFHFFVLDTTSIVYVAYSKEALLMAANINMLLGVLMFMLSVVATFCVLANRFHKWILNICLLSFALANSISFGLLGVFDGITWLYILIYSVIGLVFLHRLQVMATITTLVLLMMLWSYLAPWLPVEIRAYQFTDQVTLLSMSVFDITATWLIILATSTFCSLILDVLMAAWHRKEQDLHHSSYRDELTSLLNRRGIQDGLKEEFFRAKRGEYPLSIAMVDLDYFKQVNDRYGHPFGDKVLKLVAAKMLEITRKKDLIGRYGGEEFLIVFPECEGEVALKILERLRKNMEVQIMHTLSQQEVTVTLSAGVSTLNEHDKIDDLLARADEALYAAKRQGRNRIVYG